MFIKCWNLLAGRPPCPTCWGRAGPHWSSLSTTARTVRPTSPWCRRRSQSPSYRSDKKYSSFHHHLSNISYIWSNFCVWQDVRQNVFRSYQSSRSPLLMWAGLGDKVRRAPTVSDNMYRAVIARARSDWWITTVHKHIICNPSLEIHEAMKHTHWRKVSLDPRLTVLWGGFLMDLHQLQQCRWCQLRNLKFQKCISGEIEKTNKFKYWGVFNKKGQIMKFSI